MTTRDRPVPTPLSRRARIGWAMGGAGSTTMLYLVNAMLMFFVVTHLGIAPGIAGAILLLGRLYDGIADLAVGALSDRTHSRWGRRRPWMAGGAIICTLGTVAIFLPTLAPNGIWLYAQLALALALFFAGYSMFSVPSSAMPAEMTTDYDERTSLMSWRTLFLQVAGLVGGAGAPWLVARLGSTATAYAVMASYAALFVGATMIAAVWATRDAPRTLPDPTAAPRHAWQSVLGNRPFMILVGVKFCGFVALASMGAAGLFFVRDVLHRDEAVMGSIQLIASTIGIAALPFWRMIARHARKERVFAVATLIYGLASASWLMAGPAEAEWIMWLRAAVLGFGSTGSLLMALAMLPDAIEHDYHRTGLRREGIYAGIFEFSQKTAYAVSPFLVGLFLQFNGYHAGNGADIVQSAQATEAVREAMGLLPVLAYGLALVLIAFYRLPEQQAAARVALVR